jgi:type II secretory pathway pseudopilin PulG
MTEPDNNPSITWLELIIIIGVIIMIAAAIGSIFMSPGKQITSRDDVRKADLSRILDVIQEYQLLHEGEYPSGLEATFKDICKTEATDCTGLLVLPSKTSLPIDPLSSNPRSIGYRAKVTPNGEVVVSAPLAERKELEVRF